MVWFAYDTRDISDTPFAYLAINFTIYMNNCDIRRTNFLDTGYQIHIDVHISWKTRVMAVT